MLIDDGSTGLGIISNMWGSVSRRSTGITQCPDPAATLAATGLHNSARRRTSPPGSSTSAHLQTPWCDPRSNLVMRGPKSPRSRCVSPVRLCRPSAGRGPRSASYPRAGRASIACLSRVCRNVLTPTRSNQLYSWGRRSSRLISPMGARNPGTDRSPSPWRRMELWMGCVPRCPRGVPALSPVVSVVSGG